MTAPSSDLEAFRARRDASLAAPYGVLSQAGLHWLAPGEAPRPVADLPGRFHLDHVAVLELLAGDPAVAVRREGTTTRARVLTAEDLQVAEDPRGRRIDVIRRGERTGLRILDPANPRRTAFTGVPTFPADSAATLTGTLLRDPGEVTVDTALPDVTTTLASPGRVRLDLPTGPLELTLTGEANLLFTDETSGTESADWRVVTARIDGDEVLVDLHRAVSFPSAFSAWATCPRPPRGNHLPLAVRAGERRVQQTAS